MGSKGPKAMTAVNPYMMKSDKYPMNPDPDIGRIRSIVSYTLMKMREPMYGTGDGGEYARRYGQCLKTIEIVAEELGITGGAV